jgi:hypothetical protein
MEKPGSPRLAAVISGMWGQRRDRQGLRDQPATRLRSRFTVEKHEPRGARRLPISLEIPSPYVAVLSEVAWESMEAFGG